MKHKVVTANRVFWFLWKAYYHECFDAEEVMTQTLGYSDVREKMINLYSMIKANNE
jgi:hypothetical protein